MTQEDPNSDDSSVVGPHKKKDAQMQRMQSGEASIKVQSTNAGQNKHDQKDLSDLRCFRTCTLSGQKRNDAIARWSESDLHWELRCSMLALRSQVVQS